MNDREKLIELLESVSYHKLYPSTLASMLLANGVTVQKCCHKAESVISKTGLMCTACHSDIDREAVFCKYCGAKVMPAPPKEEPK